MQIENHIREALKKKRLLLMSHVVAGYPSLEGSLRVAEGMIMAGVDLMEIQIPCPRPVSDGDVIRRANLEALKRGVSPRDCIDLGEAVTQRFNIPLIAVAYRETIMSPEFKDIIGTLPEKGFQALLIPDMPLEGASALISGMEADRLSLVPILSPDMSIQHMRRAASLGSGLVYCKARRGVTGRPTDFSSPVATYLRRYRKASGLPLAVGFGIRERKDILFLEGKADIAAVGTRTIEIIEGSGPESVGPFLKGLMG